ncbi:2'-5' RNA ligase family protein [Deinococcus radiomollis]|uniref:2'-5' RNA ligase family protein n=1 Tax=Deinococcus radiomollis TaxID=468916 RepID=UPI0038926B84
MTQPIPAGPLYGLVAWPSPELDRWLRAQQLRLGARAYGEPHLNLRAPFPISGTEDELVSLLRSVLGGVPCFDVQIKGWRTFPSVVFLECVRSAELETLHEQVLALKCAPPQPYDQKDYIPHLTLALGVLPWYQKQLEPELERLHPPVGHFEVSALSLTREAGGEVREVHTFPLRVTDNDGTGD